MLCLNNYYLKEHELIFRTVFKTVSYMQIKRFYGFFMCPGLGSKRMLTLRILWTQYPIRSRTIPFTDFKLNSNNNFFSKIQFECLHKKLVRTKWVTSDLKTNKIRLPIYFYRVFIEEWVLFLLWKGLKSIVEVGSKRKSFRFC